MPGPRDILIDKEMKEEGNKEEVHDEKSIRDNLKHIWGEKQRQK